MSSRCLAVLVLVASSHGPCLAGDFNWTLDIQGKEFPYYNSYISVSVQGPNLDKDLSGDDSKSYGAGDSLESNFGFVSNLLVSNANGTTLAQGQHISSITFDGAKDKIKAATQLDEDVKLAAGVG